MIHFSGSAINKTFMCGRDNRSCDTLSINYIQLKFCFWKLFLEGVIVRSKYFQGNIGILPTVSYPCSLSQPAEAKLFAKKVFFSVCQCLDRLLRSNTS